MTTSEKISGQLADTAAVAARARRAEGEIVRSAEHRRDVVQAKIDELRAGASAGDDAAGREYESLIMERGRLDQIIGRSRA